MRVPLKKLGDGYYKFGTRRIYVKFNEVGELVVRGAAKGFMPLGYFFHENEDLEI